MRRNDRIIPYHHTEARVWFKDEPTNTHTIFNERLFPHAILVRGKLILVADGFDSKCM